MRLVFVNHMHPETRHVSGMRAGYFARELAALGHQVIVICEAITVNSSMSVPDQLVERLGSHDWSLPLVLSVSVRPLRTLGWLRSRKTPVLVRKALVLWFYLRHSGVFTDFSKSTDPLLSVIAREFRPQAVWGIFGNTDCWVMAQRLARLSDCGWVGDMKDPWDIFIPRPLRRLLARRFTDMSAATANAGFNAERLKPWFGVPSKVVYSGADSCWFETCPLPDSGSFRISVIGGLYGRWPQFVEALVDWLKSLSVQERSRVVLCYAGGAMDEVRAGCAALEDLCRLEIHSYLSQDELARLCRRAAVNVYFWSPKTFHHKVLELLCARRPIVAFPGEYDEAKQLTERVGGSIHVCQDAEALQQALDAILHEGNVSCGDDEGLRDYHWSAQAALLGQIFETVIGETPCDV